MGNIALDIKKWPVRDTGNGVKIVIPYKLPEPKSTRGSTVSLSETKSHKEAITSIQTAVKNWNEQSGMVELIEVQDYIKRYKETPKRWIGFATSNSDGKCKAPCFGMCPEEGEHIINCDLERVFHDNPVHHMMHEIGHILGLRHEHVTAYAQADLDLAPSFVEFDSTKMQALTTHDWYSIMHYPIAEYPNQGGYIRISKKYAQEHPLELAQLKKDVGRLEKLSQGDIYTIGKLYEQEFVAANKARTISVLATGMPSASTSSSASSTGYTFTQSNTATQYTPSYSSGSSFTHRTSLGVSNASSQRDSGPLFERLSDSLTNRMPSSSFSSTTGAASGSALRFQSLRSDQGRQPDGGNQVSANTSRASYSAGSSYDWYTQSRSSFADPRNSNKPR